MWEPPGIHSAAVSTAALIASVRAARGEDAPARLETLHVITHTGAFDAVAHVRGTAYRIDVVIGNAKYSFGRIDGKSWRRTPSGSVRIIRSDVQGDMLDRWPRALFGFDPAGCIANGGAEVDNMTTDVLDCRIDGDYEHWYFIDPRSGRILREMSREGSRVVWYDFADFRTIDGFTQPYSWRIGGADGHADVTVTDESEANVAATEVAVPSTVPATFRLPVSGVARIPAFFNYHIEVPVQIDGRTLHFTIDTGTSQTIVDIGVATRLGLNPQFGHAVIPELRAGAAIAENLPVEAIDDFHNSEDDGILGNEFFTGHVVHIDYVHQKVEMIAHDAFNPPAGAFALPIDVSEGIPIAAAAVDDVPGDRFVLDTGSYFILLRSDFANHLTHLTRSKALPPQGGFLEGPFELQPASLQNFLLGKYRFASADAMVEVPNRENTDFPLDGILGAEVLSLFDLWFDYDNGTVWMR